MTIYVTGYEGKVGRALIKRGCLPLECDVTDFDAVRKAISKTKPSLLFHLAAMTDVEWCEKPENHERALKVNFNGTSYITQACDDARVPFVFISSEHVFSGGFGKYKELDYRHAKPKNWYGYTKFGAEAAVLTSKYGRVVRTSTLFGLDSHTMMEHMDKLDKGEKIVIPTFIRRSFMYIGHFVEALLAFGSIISKTPAVTHIAGDKTENWYIFMRDFAEVFDYDTKLVVPRRNELKYFSPRPFRGGLNIKVAKKLGLPCPPYIEGLRQMKADGKP